MNDVDSGVQAAFMAQNVHAYIQAKEEEEKKRVVLDQDTVVIITLLRSVIFG